MATTNERARIGNHLGLRVVDFQCRVLRVDLRLGLCERGVRLEARNHLITFPPECRRDGARSSGAIARGKNTRASEERKRKLRGNTPITFWERCLRESAFQSRWDRRCIVPAKTGRKEWQRGWFRKWFLVRESTSDRGAEPRVEKKSETRAWSGGVPSSRARRQSPFHSRRSRARRRPEYDAAFVIVGQRGPVAIDASFRISIEYHREPVGLGKGQGRSSTESITAKSSDCARSNGERQKSGSCKCRGLSHNRRRNSAACELVKEVHAKGLRQSALMLIGLPSSARTCGPLFPVTCGSARGRPCIARCGSGAPRTFPLRNHAAS